MKKLMLLLTLSLVVVFPLAAMAAVSGLCVNCHTMHNSQGAEDMVFGTTDDSEPQSALLRSNCLGCHTTTGTDPLATPTGASGLYPFVMAASDTSFDDDNCLAGGFFTQSTRIVPPGPGDDNSDMNHTVGTTSMPAGYDSAKFPDAGGYTGDTDGLACAGSNGCHGAHNVEDDMAAIGGGHHADSTDIYRMLNVGAEMTIADGVLGSGASDYEKDMIATPADTDLHNTYSAGVDDPSISELCGICHGDFHGSANTMSGTAWIRHPTDVEIPVEWDIGIEANALTGSDYKNNPVGFDNADDSGQRMVTCLSCHRAHGTENLDLLRWGYSGDDQEQTQVAGGGNTFGCLGCHNNQQ